MNNQIKKENWEKNTQMLIGAKVKLINTNHIAVYSVDEKIKNVILNKFEKLNISFLKTKDNNRMIFKLNK